MAEYAGDIPGWASDVYSQAALVIPRVAHTVIHYWSIDHFRVSINFWISQSTLVIQIDLKPSAILWRVDRFTAVFLAAFASG
jgi:hypothetical protein